MTRHETTTDINLEGPIRILSLDGGGIYGMTGALWLRQLCEENEAFLDGTDVDVFVGCSSGACNALLLAMYERPREAVLDGLLERFWTEPGTFSNTNPMGALMSFTGKVGWFGEGDFRSQLGRYMGSKRFKDLPQKVLISTYDWHGRKTYPDLKEGEGTPRSEPSLEMWTQMWRKAVTGWLPGLDAMAQTMPVYDVRRDEKDARNDDWQSLTRVDLQGAHDRHWKPRFFKNLSAESEDNDYLIAEIAYGAATPPGFRALRGGLGDGASFSANPSVHGISAVVAHFRRERLESLFEGLEKTRILNEKREALDAACKECESDEQRNALRARLSKAEKELSTYKDLFEEAHREVYEGRYDVRGAEHRRLRARIAEQHDEATRMLLSRIRMLSLGDGTRQPYVWEADSNHGFKTWGDAPANPWRGHWYGPGSYALQASDEEAAKISRDLLGRRYCRLNPGVNDLPTVLAAYYARWPQMRALILESIRAGAKDKISREAVEKTAHFLESRNWTGKPRKQGEQTGVDEQQTELIRQKSELEAAKAELERCRSAKGAE